ncbi:MAG: FKBP-type peptidyl-prolyl cis-trans isomerase [Aliiglaciecola sp.]|uniref:FKBP-type peptidyl-prolyl cis-trans isomerase n=1 Tax=Aliiglaciecola sp. TaxID=1872441 RepID=UPI00329A6693
MDSDFSSLIMDFAIKWLPPLLAYLMLRAIAVRATLYYMMKKARTAIDPPAEFEHGVPQIVSLNSSSYDCNYVITPQDPTSYDIWQRALNVGKASWWRFAKALTIFVLALAALVFYQLHLKSTAQVTTVNTSFADSLLIILYCYMAALLLTQANKTLLGYLSLVSALLWLVFFTIVTLIVSLFLSVPLWLVALPGMLAICYFIFSFTRCQRTSKKYRNNRLLILRIFDADNSTAFTFGDISHAWRFIGSTITVADPSYLRFRYSLSYPRNKLRFLRFAFFMTLLLGGINLVFDYLDNNGLIAGGSTFPLAQQREDLLSIAAWLLVLVIAIVPMVLTFKRRFIASMSDLVKYLTNVRKDKPSTDGVFQDIAFYCHSNAWKPAIHRLIDTSNVVLMDLRGLTAEKSGSLYELDLIIHTTSLQQVVFLVNDDAEHQRLTALIKQALVNANTDSPNRNAMPIDLNIYQPGSYEPRDTDKLLAMLAAATGEQMANRFSHTIEQLSQWQKFKILIGKPAKIWRRLRERMDMTFSRPPLAYVTIPVLLILVIGLFLLRLNPVMNETDNQQSVAEQTLPNESKSGDIFGETMNKEPKLESDLPQYAYALGATMGGYASKEFDNLIELDLAIDKAQILQGFTDTLYGETRYNEEQIRTIISSLNKVSRERKAQADSIKAKQNIRAGQAWLAENKKRVGVVTTKSGLQYEVLTLSEGQKASATDTVKVHYRGQLLDGTEFDSSYSRGQAATLPLNRVIAGWTEGIQLMPVGSTYKFYIPSELAYGERATGMITANSTLIFEVELLEIVGK